LSSELRSPLCNCQFSTVEDLAAHLKTHKDKVKESNTEDEVTITEVGAGLKEITATAVSVTKDCNCNLCRKAREKARFKSRYSRWHITLRPEREEYKDFHVWITADSAYAKDPKTAGKGTQLGDYIVRLKQLGFKGRTVDELLASMQGKLFVWERAKIGRRQRETWVPKQLLTTKEAREADPVQACVERIINVLERGRAYTIEDAKANGVDFPDEVVEKAFELLVEKGKAFELPTKPVKWFYEG